VDSSYVTPNSVQTIEQASFTSNASLQSVKLVNGITSIGSSAFSGCRGLMSMDIPSSVTNIGYSAFLDCNGISEYKVYSKDAKALLINSYSGIDPSKIKIYNENLSNKDSSSNETLVKNVENVIASIEVGNVRDKETIITQHKNSAEILGIDKKVDLQFVDDKTTFNSKEWIGYLKGSENVIGTINSVWNDVNGSWYAEHSEEILKINWNKDKEAWNIRAKEEIHDGLKIMIKMGII
ncbi:Leucine rich repeat-containing protein, partial [Clostridium cavendishii DSM 21758]